jgi:hypothetical protein
MPWLGAGTALNSLQQKGIRYSKKCSILGDFATLNSLPQKAFGCDCEMFW